MSGDTIEVLDTGIALADGAFIPSAEFVNEVEPGSLKAVKTAHQRVDSLIWVDPKELVVVQGHNVRLETPRLHAHIEYLTRSIIDNGFDPSEPLKLYVRLHNGQNQLVVNEGHNRLRATLRAIEQGANIPRIPAYLHPKTTTGLDLLYDMGRSNNGKLALEAYEAAVLAKRALNYGASEAEIARALGYTPSYVNGLLLLGTASREVGAYLGAGWVAAATVIDLIREHGQLETARMLREAIEAKRQKLGLGEDGSDPGQRDGQKPKVLRVSKKDLPGAKFKSVLRKSSGALHSAAEAVQRDPGFLGLSAETRELVADLLDQLRQAKGEGEGNPDESQLALLPGDGGEQE